MPKNKTLNLIYRGSKNGFSATNFHSICDNQSGIITVIQSDSGRIFGEWGGWLPNDTQDFKKWLV